MYYEEAADFQAERRRRMEAMGIPVNAGSLTMLTETQRPYHIQQAFENRFGDILNGGLKKDLRKYDTTASPYAPLGDGNFRDAPAYVPSKRNMDPRQRRMEAAKRGQSHQPLPPVALPPVAKPLSRDILDIAAMFGEDVGGQPSRRMGGMSDQISTDDFKSAPSIDSAYYSFKNKLRNEQQNPVQQRAFSNVQQGLDYRNMDRSASQGEPEVRINPVDTGMINEMVQTMAQNLAQSAIKEYVLQQKGKNFFKKVKYNNEITPPDPKAANAETFLMEMNDKYYKVTMQPVKIKNKK